MKPFFHTHPQTIFIPLFGLAMIVAPERVSAGKQQDSSEGAARDARTAIEAAAGQMPDASAASAISRAGGDDLEVRVYVERMLRSPFPDGELSSSRIQFLRRLFSAVADEAGRRGTYRRVLRDAYFGLCEYAENLDELEVARDLARSIHPTMVAMRESPEVAFERSEVYKHFVRKQRFLLERGK